MIAKEQTILERNIRLVQDKWDENFVNDIKIVIGDEWSAGNYHIIYLQDQSG